eukprot:2673829-Pleurochrysis_carterae.AAC.1
MEGMVGRPNERAILFHGIWFSGMPGGSEVQKRAGRLQQPFELKSMRDPKGRRFYDRFVVPWLLKAWKAVLATAPQAAALAWQEQLGSDRTLSGTGFTKVTVALNNPPPYV